MEQFAFLLVLVLHFTTCDAVLLYGSRVTPSPTRPGYSRVETFEINPANASFHFLAHPVDINADQFHSVVLVSGFDQWNQRYYFASADTWEETQYLYGIDVVAGQLLTPVALRNVLPDSIYRDYSGKQILVQENTSLNGSFILNAYPDDQPPFQLFNFTYDNIIPLNTAIDPIKGVYYAFTFKLGEQQELSSRFLYFPLADPSAAVQTSVPCGSPALVESFFDQNTATLRGIMGFSSPDLNLYHLKLYYFETNLPPTTCKLVKLPIEYYLEYDLAIAYDSAAATFYVHYNTTLYTYDVRYNRTSSVNLNIHLATLETSNSL